MKNKRTDEDLSMEMQVLMSVVGLHVISYVHLLFLLHDGRKVEWGPL
jgi:hypothetical protein